MPLSRDQSAEFIELLERLTAAGAAEWLLQHEEEPGFVFCFVAGERIDFVVCGAGGEEEPIAPSSPEVTAVAGRWRHHHLLFLAPEEMHPTLLPLLRRASADLPRWRQLTHEATKNALDVLRRERATRA